MDGAGQSVESGFMNSPPTPGDVKLGGPRQHVVQISDPEPYDVRNCIRCIVIALTAAFGITVFVFYTYGFNKIQHFFVPFSSFLLIYLSLEIIASARQRDEARGIRTLLVGYDLWIKPHTGDFERIPLADLIRVRTIVAAGIVRIRCLRCDFMAPNGSMRHIDFVPHPQYRFDAQDDNALSDTLLRLAEEARDRRQWSFHGGDEFLDLREVVPFAAAKVESSAANDVATTKNREFIVLSGNRLSESDHYMRHWYPLNWLWLPAMLSLIYLVSSTIFPGKLWASLALAVFLMAVEYYGFRSASVGLVRNVVLKDDALHYMRDGRPARLALTDIIEIRIYWARLYFGRKPVRVRYIDGALIREIRFIARRNRSWNSLRLYEAFDELNAEIYHLRRMGALS